jgi:hypothetical protein
MSANENTRKEILEHYQHARGSIQDLARIYEVPVDEVLEIIGEGSLSTVPLTGDLIDAAEAGPGAKMNYGGEIRVPFTVN